MYIFSQTEPISMINLIYKYLNEWGIPAFLLSKHLFFLPLYGHLFIFKSLITHIILLPSTRMRHQFFCHGELQISFELAREEMGGDGSGRRWRDKLRNMFELALTHSGRESTLANRRDICRQIVAFQSREWRFLSPRRAAPVPLRSGRGLAEQVAAREKLTCAPPSLQLKQGHLSGE